MIIDPSLVVHRHNSRVRVIAVDDKILAYLGTVIMECVLCTV